MAASPYVGVLVFTVPGGKGQYGDQFEGQAVPPSAAENDGTAALLGLTAVCLSGLPANATLEVWFLKPGPGVDPTVIGSYAFGQTILPAPGSVSVPLCSYPGCLLRVKSGGTAGTATVWYSAD